MSSDWLNVSQSAHEPLYLHSDALQVLISSINTSENILVDQIISEKR